MIGIRLVSDVDDDPQIDIKRQVRLRVTKVYATLTFMLDVWCVCVRYWRFAGKLEGMRGDAESTTPDATFPPPGPQAQQ